MQHQLSYKERSTFCTNPSAKALFALMEEKQSNLCVATDVVHAEELLTLAEEIGDEIVLFKTHIDIIEDFTPQLTEKLKEIALKKQFLIFEDRKFADIGNTVLHQYGGGIYRIADWADITNAHILPGPGLIEGLQKIGLPKGRGLFLLAEMSSKGNLTGKEHAQKAAFFAQQFPDFVIGFIAQSQILKEPQWIHATPGINLETSQDLLGQQYLTPEIAIDRGTDLLIVGRGIYGAKDRQKAAAEYRERGWKAYFSKRSINTILPATSEIASPA